MEMTPQTPLTTRLPKKHPLNSPRVLLRQHRPPRITLEIHARNHPPRLPLASHAQWSAPGTALEGWSRSAMTRNPTKIKRVARIAAHQNPRLALGSGTEGLSMTSSQHRGGADSLGADPMATVRALKRIRGAGFTMAVEDDRLVVEPLSNLSDAQRQFIRARKAALVALLQDAEAVYAALAQAGSSGLAWREGTPADWTGERLLAAQEVLYHDRRMVFADGRHYLRACAPPILDVEGIHGWMTTPPVVEGLA